MDLTLPLAVAGAGVFAAWQSSVTQRRAKEMRSLAAEIGFVFIGGALPRSVDLEGTGVEGVTAVWNVIDGDRHGSRVVAFDCRIGTGKGSWRRTVIAAQGEDVVCASFGGYGLEVERAGLWQVMYERTSLFGLPQGLMPVPELAAHLKAFDLGNDSNRSRTRGAK